MTRYLEYFIPCVNLSLAKKYKKAHFFFHVIYLNFILSFHVKTKYSTHDEIWLVENFDFYSLTTLFLGITFLLNQIVKKHAKKTDQINLFFGHIKKCLGIINMFSKRKKKEWWIENLTQIKWYSL
jgi:uncharacterized membrane protein